MLRANTKVELMQILDYVENEVFGSDNLQLQV